MSAIREFHGQIPREGLMVRPDHRDRSRLMAANGTWSKAWTFLDGDWHEGNFGIIGPRSHAFWLSSSVFDGARAFEGVTPDLDLHCDRVNDSAPKLLLKPAVTRETWMGLVK